MKVTAVFTACLALAVAHYTDLRLTDDAAIENIPHVHWMPTDMNTGYWADHSAIPVKVAQSLFRTYGFDQPSDVDIDNFAEDVDDIDEYVPAKLRSLYTEPVVIFLGDADKNNFVGYYADRGINAIKAYPEMYDVLKNMLGASNVVSLNYRPEMLLYPEDRYAVSNRFFAPKNFRIVPWTAEFDRAAENYRVNEAPVVLRKYEIPYYYPDSRTPYVDFDIEKIPYAHRYPVTLKMSETFAYPLWKKQSTPYYMYPFSTEYTPNAYRTLPGKYMYYPYDTDYIPNAYRTLPAKYNELDAYTYKHYCAKYPQACPKLVKINTDYDNIPHKTFPFDYPIHIAKEDALKTAHFENYMNSDDAVNMCAKNPLACSMYLKSTRVPLYWDSLSNVPFTADHMHDSAFHVDKTDIIKPNKVILPKTVLKNNVPHYLEDYNPAVVRPVMRDHGVMLKTILGSQ